MVGRSPRLSNVEERTQAGTFHEVLGFQFSSYEITFSLLKLALILYKSTHGSNHLETETKPSPRRPVLIWLIVSQLLALASLFFWLLMAGLSVMAFDSGVSTAAWTFVIAVWSYPIWPIAFAIASWIAYARKKDRLAGVLTTFTFLPMLLLLAVIVIGNFMFTLGM